MNRAWLRSFLRLDAVQQVERISEEAIRLQEDTVLAALGILEREPGVLLADEVGMGKTYQALGLLAAHFHKAGQSSKIPRVLVVTPNLQLNRQWFRAATTFKEKGFYRGFPAERFSEALHIRDLPDAATKHSVVFAPVNIFTSARGYSERGFILELWFAHRQLHGSTRSAIRQRLADANVIISEGQTFLGRNMTELGRIPAAAFKKSRGGYDGLDDLYEAEGLEGFTNARAVKKAIDRVRFHLVRELLPCFDLLVVDEAHKLKNPWTVQAQAVSQVLGGRFRRAVFLTATPFQLDVIELRRVFEMFNSAREVRAGFREDVDTLFAAIKDYQETYGFFESAWRYADWNQASGFARWYDRVASTDVSPEPTQSVPGIHEDDDPNVVALARYAWQLRRLKHHGVEPGFRRWTVRSLKPRKRERRKSYPDLITADESALSSLILYQRLMLARAEAGKRSHIEAAETNVASSYAAAREGAAVSAEVHSPEALAYQSLVGKLLASEFGNHPKVSRVLSDTMDAAKHWEKSLVFCERNATIDELHTTIEEHWMRRLLDRWQRLYPSANHEGIFGAGSGDGRIVGIFQRWATKFTKGQDQLSIALRESYPHTLFVPPGEDGLPKELWSDVAKLLCDTNAALRGQKANGTSASRLNYRLAKRSIDVAVARWFERRRPSVLDEYGGIPQRLLDPSYLRDGIDLKSDDEEQELIGSADAEIEWSVSEEVFWNILHPERPSIWFPFRTQLSKWDPTERGHVVQAIRTFLTRRQVPFLLDLLEAAGSEATSNSIRDTLENQWRQTDWLWRRRVTEFLDYLPRLGKAERSDVLALALKSGELVARGNSDDSQRRQAIQDAFNTPFFPMILVGNRTMQEGLNLHRQCRRVIHHDLRWNPADVEQRVGRVDRHGSLAERMLTESGEVSGHIIIRTPLLDRTIDPVRYRRVKEREKWLDFLLGVAPEVGRESLEDQEIVPLPEKFTEALRIHLGPVAAE